METGSDGERKTKRSVCERVLREMTVMRRDKQVEWGSFRDRLLPRP
jgi:hypothetical protein